MAKFLDKSYTDDEIRSLVAFTSFKSMQNKNEDFTKYLVDINVFEADMQFFRKGKIGDWQNHFTDELSQIVDEWIQRNLKSKLTFNYGSLDSE
jgi:estrone sulfotransferase